MQKIMSRTPLGDIMSPLQGGALSRKLLEPTLNEMFGPDTKPSAAMMEQFHQILDYNDGKRVLHKVGRFLDDRVRHRNRWVRAMRETAVPMRLIDGPVDPNSGAHMAARYREVIPDADVVMLADGIGHWPQLEAPDAVLAHFLPGVQARDVRRGRGRELRGELRSPTITHEALQGRIALCVLLDEAPAEPVHDEQDHRAVGRRAVGQRIGGQRDALLPGQQAGDARGNRGEAVPVVGRRDETGIELEHDILVEDWTRGFSRFGGVRMYPD